MTAQPRRETRHGIGGNGRSNILISIVQDATRANELMRVIFSEATNNFGNKLRHMSLSKMLFDHGI
jgi:hypothetical protein